MPKNYEIYKIPEKATLTQNELEKFLSKDKSIIHKLVELGYLSCVASGNRNVFYFFQIKEFLDDVFNGTLKARTEEHKKFINKHFRKVN